ASLRIKGNRADQLLSDLDSMNSVEVITGNVVPLERWLINASHLISFFPEKQRFFRELADEVASKRNASVPAESSIIESEVATVEERVIFINDMIPFGFLEGARRTGESIARMLVPRFEGGSAVTRPFSSEQVIYLGTAWLIGSRHILTNHHVINARNPGEADASTVDFQMQGEASIAQFDYDFDMAPGVKEKISKVILKNKALDFALLELAQASNRDPLVLWGKELVLHSNSYVPVNVIQHPGGASKQMAIRNNLMARLLSDDLAYFSDTEGGSSGSPVCNDNWEVIALHKASTRAHGDFQFQGKTTAWVNIGTRIDRIIGYLRDKHPAVWESIGANVRS
ncbi:MAG: serine protease, partial [Candidatus Electrothrix sp. GM3_4]|nr:serine protease [Candidatus Electrothrix sp. GM3_4]